MTLEVISMRYMRISDLVKAFRNPGLNSEWTSANDDNDD